MGPILLPSYAPPLRALHTSQVCRASFTPSNLILEWSYSLQGGSQQHRCFHIVIKPLHYIFLIRKLMMLFNNCIHSRSNEWIYKHCCVLMRAPTCVPRDLIWPCLSTYLPEYKRKGNYLHDHTVVVLHPTTEKFNYLMVNSSLEKTGGSGPSFLTVVVHVFHYTARSVGFSSPICEDCSSCTTVWNSGRKLSSLLDG